MEKNKILNKLNTLITKILRKFLRRDYPLGFTYMCSYIVDPSNESLSKIKRNFIELMPFCRYKRRYMKIHFSERIIEIPFVLQNIPHNKDIKILEIGCSDSPISMHLSNLGYQVAGVSLTDYPFLHPNFKFYKRNFFDCDFKENSFDVVILLSTIEHVGLNVYGNKLIDDEGDIKLMEAVHGVLKPGGIVVLTTPYGRYGVRENYRVYDEKRLNKLLACFSSKSFDYYKREKLLYYQLAKKENVDNLDSTKGGGVQGLVCVVVKK